MTLVKNEYKSCLVCCFFENNISFKVIFRSKRYLETSRSVKNVFEDVICLQLRLYVQM